MLSINPVMGRGMPYLWCNRGAKSKKKNASVENQALAFFFVCNAMLPYSLVEFHLNLHSDGYRVGARV